MTGEGMAAKESKPVRKTTVFQTDIPSFTLEEALRVPGTIVENYGSKPASPLDVAAGLNTQPTSGIFRMLIGASAAYGLTTGSYNSQNIQLTELGKRAVNNDIAARKEAVLRPRILREFLQKYDTSKLPKESLVEGILAGMGVPRDSAKKSFGLIMNNANFVGFLRDIAGSKYVELNGTNTAALDEVDVGSEEEAEAAVVEKTNVPVGQAKENGSRAEPSRARRVFIAHGKNKDFLPMLKEFLKFGELEAIVSVERESVSLPLPDKVMNDMRSCSAAVIHVDGEQKLIDEEGRTHTILNSNVLIEIGAAFALYGRRFILLVRDGITLPSNLSGLYEVRYTGETLDAKDAIKLMKAINELKTTPLPT
jgi:predicted nucleotide-binding protein